jgi:Cu/Ag efflux protein CusF
MSKSLSSIVVAIALAAAGVAAQAQQAPKGATAMTSEPGKVSVADTVQASAAVQAIDKAQRLVTLKGADGNTFVIQAGPEVKNFDQIKVGDQVVVRYLQALTLELKKGGGGVREKVENEGAAAAKPGEKPAGAMGRTVTVTADIIALDEKKQTARVRGPQRTIDLKVNDPAQFKLMKVGDQIEAKFVEAVALSVEPAAKK